MLPDRLSPAQINWNTVPALLAPAFSIAVLNMLESLLCGASAGRATGVKLNNDQELFAQGVGNMVLPMFGGIPATAALARTSVAVRSGAQTRLTGIFHAVGLLIMMFLLAPVIQNVPLAASGRRADGHGMAHERMAARSSYMFQPPLQGCHGEVYRHHDRALSYST